ncbi:hypothetical protein DVH24_021416 [Malus domestica]|uniref:Uncharacterized protein n=1 Tax=Malus domestica TaxID=3750 RepID=A0A498K120_MALDO|nr:hypothetical protein DVH24_021416 [Malus domestica]
MSLLVVDDMVEPLGYSEMFMNYFNMDISNGIKPIQRDNDAQTMCNFVPNKNCPTRSSHPRKTVPLVYGVHLYKYNVRCFMDHYYLIPNMDISNGMKPIQSDVDVQTMQLCSKCLSDRHVHRRIVPTRSSHPRKTVSSFYGVHWYKYSGDRGIK